MRGENRDDLCRPAPRRHHRQDLSEKAVLEIPDGLRHIAIIMDGNGRWANSRGLRRTRGHKEGVKSVRRITTACAEAGLEQLTLYALSVENWAKRPRPEIEFLLLLLKRFVAQERRTIMENNIRFRTVGRTHEFPKSVRDELDRLTEVSAANDGMVLCLALNYGGRSEIADAARELGRQVRDGALDPEKIDEQTLARALYDPAMPDVDLMIRTAGEMRISNFLLWQASYGEIWVAPALWPDFDVKDLATGLASYGARERKFGGLAQRIDA
ncbi:MAG: di-trans,poly-cis-decaprenylcistransferase [Planctomycetes bacterium]|nr:di-trans,poly-cis-decaprenylcistransferase [Planctomycetota bacterium]